MNKLFFPIFALIFALSAPAFASFDHNMGDHLTVLDLIPAATVTTTGNGSSVDLQAYTGQIAFVLDAHNVSGTTPTLDIKIQDSADNSSFADVSPSVAFTQVTTTDSVQKLVVDKGALRRYIRAVKTAGGTSPNYVMSLKGYANKKQLQ